jgi:hypothetical protein
MARGVFRRLDNMAHTVGLRVVELAGRMHASAGRREETSDGREQVRTPGLQLHG